MANDKKISCLIFTVGRSDFGILKNIILYLEKSKLFNSKLIITGAHFSKIFGNTINEIKRDKIKKKIFLKVNYKNNKNSETNISVNLMTKSQKLFKKIKPSFIVILGDRYEAFSIALSAFINNIPIVHFCGGSDTLGSKDDKYRYLISKISNIHMVETEYHKRRLLENGIKNKIHVIGAPALENIKKIKFISTYKILKQLNITYNKNEKYILGSFHPETVLNIERNKENLIKLLNFLNSTNFVIIFTYPNADQGFNEYIKIIKKNQKLNKKFYIFKNLGNTKYFQLLKKVDALISNSSSGIIETGSFNLPTINVGDRQKGRISDINVVNSSFDKKDLKKKLKNILKRNFKKKIIYSKKIYRLRKNSEEISKILKDNFFLK